MEVKSLLSEIGFTYCCHELIGQGGQFSTYLINVIEDTSSCDRKLVLKTVQSGKNHAALFGYDSNVALLIEAKYTEILGKAGFGPCLLYSDERYVIRDYAFGKTLRDALLESSDLVTFALIKAALAYLEEILQLAEAENLVGYLDFHCENILVDKENCFSLIDHEWGILPYKKHQHLCIATIYKFVRELAELTPLSIDEILNLIRLSGYLSEFLPRVVVLLAGAFYENRSASLQEKLLSSHELLNVLHSRKNYSDPIALIKQLCSVLGDNAVRYCFARKYEEVFDGEYKEKDIDLFVHPDDFISMAFLIQEMGGVFFGETKALYYCGGSEQVVFLDINLTGRELKHQAFQVRDIVARRIKVGRQYFISDEDMFVQVIANALDRKKALSKAYRSFISRSVAEDGLDLTYIEAAFVEAFGGVIGKRALNYACAGEWANLEGLGVKHKKAKATPLSFFVSSKNKLQELMERGPRLVALLGVDGAGKSTTARSVQVALEKARFSSINHYLGCYYPPSGRGQSFVLPTDRIFSFAYKLLLRARRLRLAPRKITSEVRSPQKYGAKEFVFDASIDDKPWIVPMEPGGECFSIVFRLYAFLLVLDCILMAIKLRFSYGTLYVFTDRYFYDLITFLGRDHYLSRFIARNFAPDVAIFLYASPEVQVKREPRHPLSEIRANQSLYRSVPIHNPSANWFEVSTELPREVVAQRVLYLCVTTRRQRSLIKLANNLYRSFSIRCGRVRRALFRK